jgi:plasmid maintenance system antidote protein VapI
MSKTNALDKEKDPITYYTKVFEEFSNNLNNQLELGKLNKKEAKQLYQNALADFNNKIIEYTYNNQEPIMSTLAEFANSTLEKYQYQLPNILAGLIEEEYESEDDAVAVMKQLGFKRKEIEAIFTGDQVPTVAGIDKLASMFDLTSTDEQAYLELQMYGLADRNLLAQEEDEDEETEDDLIAELEELYSDEDEEDSNDDEEETEDEEDEETEIVDARYSALEQQLTEFKAADAIKTTLNRYIREATEMLDNGEILPSEFSALFNGVEEVDDNEKVAAFKQFCTKNELNQFSTEYGAYMNGFKLIEFGLSLFKQRGKLPLFEQVSREQEKEYLSTNANFSKQEKQEEAVGEFTGKDFFKRIQSQLLH